jgi:hypothetical protein
MSKLIPCSYVAGGATRRRPIFYTRAAKVLVEEHIIRLSPTGITFRPSGCVIHGFNSYNFVTHPTTVNGGTFDLTHTGPNCAFSVTATDGEIRSYTGTPGCVGSPGVLTSLEWRIDFVSAGSSPIILIRGGYGSLGFLFFSATVPWCDFVEGDVINNGLTSLSSSGVVGYGGSLTFAVDCPP